MESRWTTCDVTLREFDEDEKLSRQVTLQCKPGGINGGWALLQVSGCQLERHEMDCFDRIARALEELQNGPSAEARGFTLCPECEGKWRNGEIADPQHAICGVNHENRKMCQACRGPFGEPIAFAVAGLITYPPTTGGQP
jgi:hypothetical protein